MWKYQALIVSLASSAAFAAVDLSKFPSKTDPTHFTIPSIPQTTSHDVATECQYYQSNFTIDKTQWPTVWDIATSNNMNTSAEFMSVYNAIDWTKVPTAPVRKLTAAGGLDLTGYDTVNDPDCWWSASQCVKPKANGVNPDIYACPEPETWGLTFDDGPNCSHNAFYDYLETNKQRASMFYIGSNVLNWPFGALRGLKDGHHLCGHTWSHRMMTTLSNQEVLAELYYTAKAIKYVTGVTPLHWRPALGDLDDRVRWIASQLNMTAILWNLDTDDWAAGSTPGITADTVNQRYKDFIQMGSNGTYKDSGNIVLSHEINNMTMDFFVNHYPDIKKNYKHVADVATCMNIAHPYLEKVITFPSFDASVNSNAGTATGSGVIPGASSAPSSGNSVTPYTNFYNGPLFIAALFGLLLVAV
ncbi:hypothetical protein BD408DRAFT_426821 [Parasitella parasitica]|nr:hypothetical protein BD408DRAFT_426821 [Parasitella parasitica]